MASPPSSTPALHFANFEADMGSRVLRRDGAKVRLPDQSFQILAMLLEHPGELVTREQIRTRLWPGDTFVDFDHGLNNAVNRLRDALGDAAGSPRFIETLPRRGYRFIAPVIDTITPAHVDAGAMSVTAKGGVAPTGANPQLKQSATVIRVLRVRLAAITLLFVLALGLTTTVLLRHRPPAEGRLKIQSIAVLPLENLSSDPSQEYFTDGMTDALITELAKLSQLRVISRTSTTHYKKTNKNVKEIANELNVDAVVEGTVLRAGNRIRIDAQLIYAPTDSHVWANSYEREIGDVLILQGEVARSIAGEIHTNISPRESVQISKQRTVNPEAYEEFLKGNYYSAKLSAEGWREAPKHFQKSIQLDPTYGPAYAGLADAYTAEAIMDLVPPAKTFSNVRDLSLKALQLDPSLSNPYIDLGWADLFDWNWRSAESELQQAVQLGPNNPHAHLAYFHVLVIKNQIQAAAQQLRYARDLDPIAPDVSTIIGINFRSLRQYDSALQSCQKTLQLDPSFAVAHWCLGSTYLLRREFDAAIRELDYSTRNSGNLPMFKYGLAYAYAAKGNHAALAAALKECERDPTGYYYAAIILTLSGDIDGAFSWLDQAYLRHDGKLVFLKDEPFFDALRHDPRYLSLLNRIGLPL